MKCEISIKMDNAAFIDDPGELARKLREVAEYFRYGPVVGAEVYSIRDTNGSTIGTATITDNDE